MSSRTIVAVTVAVYLALAVANGSAWEHQHDEGITFDVALGRLVLEPGVSRPLSEVYADLGDAEGHGAAEVIGALREPGRMPHPPAYYLLVRGWVSWAGLHPLAVRLPMYLIGVLTLLGMTRLARRLVPDPGGAAWVAVLVALSPWFHGISNFARPYALALCAAVWSTVCVLALGDSGARRARWSAAFVVLSLLGMYTVYHHAFVLAWQLVVLAVLAVVNVSGRGRGGSGIAAWTGLGLVVLVIAAGYAPWLEVLREHLGATGGRRFFFSGTVPLVEWPMRLGRLLDRFLIADGRVSVGGDAVAAAALVLELATLGAVAVLLARRVAGRRARRVVEERRASDLDGGRVARLLDTPARAVWAMAVLLPLLVTAGDLWRDTRTLFVAKYSFGLFPFVVLLLVRVWLRLGAGGAAGGRARHLRSIGVGALSAWCLLFIATEIAVDHTRRAGSNDHEMTAAVLALDDQPDHHLVLSTDLRGAAVPFLLTLRDAGLRELTVTCAPPDALPAVVQRLVGGGIARRITLVNLHVVYDPERSMWDRATLERAAAGAMAAGWNVRAGPPSAHRADRAALGSTMSIVSPVTVRSFHGAL